MTRLVAYWIALLLFAVLVLIKFSPQTGFTSLIRFGETWQERRHSALEGLRIATTPDSSGYDGQFYAQIAIDPLLRDTEIAQTIDVPAYRSRRILTPAIAAILGLGDPWRTLQAYALVNVFCWFALSWLLYLHIDGVGSLAFARWVGCMFSLGVLESVRQSLVDLPALLLIALAITTYQRSRIRLPVFWLALANLAKETSLLGTVSLYCDPSRPILLRRIIYFLVITILPLACWSLYVEYRLSNLPEDNSLGNFTWPLLGVLMQIQHSLREVFGGNFDGRYSYCLIAVFSLVIQFGMIWYDRQTGSPWWRIGAAYSLLILFLSDWVWSGYWAVCRIALPMTIAFNLLLPANKYFWSLWILGNLTLLHGVWRFL